MKDNKPWLVCLKWGAILGVALAIFEVVKMVALKVQFEGAKMFDIALIIVFILIIHGGVKEFKGKYPKRLSFAKAFGASCLISLVGAVIFFAYDMLHYSVIDKSGLDRKYEVALGNFKKVIENDTITTNELNEYLDTVEAMMTEQEDIALQSGNIQDSLKNDIHRGVSMIERVYAEKIRSSRAVDSTQSYQMVNFSSFSRRTLMETLEAYVEQNQQEPSTPQVQQVVTAAASALADVNPVDARFERNKSHVPRYDSPGVYASVSSLMNLLYGMFFGIFVAMFHYRSKNPIEEKVDQAPSEEELAARAKEVEHTENPNEEQGS